MANLVNQLLMTDSGGSKKPVSSSGSSGSSGTAGKGGGTGGVTLNDKLASMTGNKGTGGSSGSSGGQSSGGGAAPDYASVINALVEAQYAGQPELMQAQLNNILEQIARAIEQVNMQASQAETKLKGDAESQKQQIADYYSTDALRRGLARSTIPTAYTADKQGDIVAALIAALNENEQNRNFYVQGYEGDKISAQRDFDANIAAMNAQKGAEKYAQNLQMAYSQLATPGGSGGGSSAYDPWNSLKDYYQQPTGLAKASGGVGAAGQVKTAGSSQDILNVLKPLVSTTSKLISPVVKMPSNVINGVKKVFNNILR